jgi:hypothetical protein
MNKKIPRGEDSLNCPLLLSPMSEVCHKCPWWTQVRGVNPNTGAEVDDWNCAIGLLPMLLVNVAQESRQGAAATESFRNESLKMGALQLMRRPTEDRPSIPQLLGLATFKGEASPDDDNVQ